MTLYDLLEIPANASEKEIKSAYKRLARKYHPDVNKDGAAMFVKINNAYSILSDPIQKIKYDMMVNTSTAHTFEIFTKGQANPDTYYSQADLWHQSFMRQNTPTTEWDFGPNYFGPHPGPFPPEPPYMDEYVPFEATTQHVKVINGPKAYLDPDVSAAYFGLFKHNTIDPEVAQRLLRKDEAVAARITLRTLTDFVKFKYDFASWVKTKRHMDIDVLLEVTQDEITNQTKINLPLKLKIINHNPISDLWHEEPINYVFALPKGCRNGEVLEFFHKGNKALGWQGDLVVTVRVVTQIKDRIKVYCGEQPTDYTRLWFALDPAGEHNNSYRYRTVKTR